MRQICLLALLLLVSSFAGCRQATPPPPAPVPPEVFVAQPVEETVVDFEDYPGRLAAVETVEIRSRVTGYLDTVLFKDGDFVKAGQVLFEIDARPYKAEVDRTAASLAQAKAHLDRMKRQEERALALNERKAISQEQFETTKFDREEARASLDAAEAANEAAELNLEYTKVRSRIDGKISRRLADPGNLIKADDTHLATVVRLDPIYAYFAIDERTLLKLQRLIQDGTLTYAQGSTFPVQLALADEDDFHWTGVVNFLDNQVDPQTGTLAARATIDNRSGFLSPGLFARMRTPIGSPHPALLIPEEALGSDQGQRFLYVVDDQDQVTYRRVKVGQANKGRRVVTEGLERGESVIVSGLQRVRPGQKVTTKPQVAPAEVAQTAAPAVTKPQAASETAEPANTATTHNQKPKPAATPGAE